MRTVDRKYEIYM